MQKNYFYLVFVISFLFGSSFAIGQEDTTLGKDSTHLEDNYYLEVDRKANTFYAEAFGNGIFYSLNYDRVLRHYNFIGSSISTGFSVTPKSIDFLMVALPISFNGLFGGGSHFFEIGIVLTPYYLSTPFDFITEHIDPITMESTYTKNRQNTHNFYLSLTPKIGYRFQQPNGGLFAKVNLTFPLGVNARIEEDETQGNYTYEMNHITSFRNEVLFQSKVAPWFAVSLGWTF